MPEKISICSNRGREESAGNDDVSIVYAREYEIVRMTWPDDVKTENSEGTAYQGRFCHIYCTVILRYSLALRVISDILWSSYFERYGPKDTREVIRCVQLCIYINTWRVCKTRVHKSLIGNLARHSFPLLDRNKTQPQRSKTSEQRLAYH